MSSQISMENWHASVEWLALVDEVEALACDLESYHAADPSIGAWVLSFAAEMRDCAARGDKAGVLGLLRVVRNAMAGVGGVA